MYDKITQLAFNGFRKGQIAALLERKQDLFRKDAHAEAAYQKGAAQRKLDQMRTGSKFTNRMQQHRALKRDVRYGAPANLPARRRAEKNLGRWLKRYMPDAYALPWADFHKVSIRKLQSAIEQGGNFAIALPRGSGKTTLCKGAVLWALMTGRKRFVLVVCATGKKAEALIKDIKNIVRFNDLLAADYPEICEPIRDLAGVAIKASVQTAYGEPTMIELGAGKLALPATRRRDDAGKFHDNPSAGSMVTACGITGDIRGAQVTTPDGEVLRPDFCLCDDPQTRESAKSSEQTKFRLDVILSDIAASEGTKNPISIVVPCTIIRRADLAAQLLDHELHPDFRGECHPLIEGLPDDLDHWDEYNAERIAGLESEDGGKGAAAYYRKHRKTLDGDMSPTWPARKVGRVSAIQYALDKYFTLGPDAFAAEYQNAPEGDPTIYDLDEQTVMSRVNGYKINEVPSNVGVITAFADINRAGLHWVLAGFTHPLAGHVLNYGKWPRRGDLWRKNANQVEMRKAIHDGLTGLAEHLDALPLRKDGEPAKINHVMIDAGYESETVYNWCRFARYSFPVMPSRGVAHHRYFPNHKTAVANSHKDGCHMAEVSGNQFIVHDACRWREFTQKGFLSNVGAPGSVAIYGSKGLAHKAFAEHICAEVLSDVAVGDKGKVYQWATLPRPHDWLDALVGAFVGAAWMGFQQSGEMQETVVIRRPIRKARR